MIKFKRLFDDAIIPKRGSKKSAGFDLYSYIDARLYVNEKLKIPTGIAVAIPDDRDGKIEPRSGLANRHDVEILAGEIDPDYRGEINVLLKTTRLGLGEGVLVDDIGRMYLPIKKGDRIAQIVFRYICTDAVEVDELDDTDRGEGGFGSTGR